jgi:hypothetical protein
MSRLRETDKIYLRRLAGDLNQVTFALTPLAISASIFGQAIATQAETTSHEMAKLLALLNAAGRPDSTVKGLTGLAKLSPSVSGAQGGAASPQDRSAAQPGADATRSEAKGNAQISKADLLQVAPDSPEHGQNGQDTARTGQAQEGSGHGQDGQIAQEQSWSGSRLAPGASPAQDPGQTHKA